jgi:hypothetical protein
MACLDITNYAYVWYKKNSDKILEFTTDEKEIIYNIIISFSYPCYLGNDSIRHLSDIDKKELLEHELLFIRKRFEEVCLIDVIIMQIPRVLYDLFNLYYYNKFNKLDDQHLRNINYDLDEKIQNKDNYRAYTFYNMQNVKNNIFELNNIIINYIASYLNYDITLEYHNILRCLIEEYNSYESLIQWRRHLKFNFLPNQIKILDEVLNFEKQSNSGYTLLYRGANYEVDSIIRKKEKIPIKNLNSQIHYYSATDIEKEDCDKEIMILEINSLSLNMSILSGIVGDSNACTLNYISRTSFHSSTYKKDNKKIKYNVKKFHLDDSSNEFSLYFIPPLHPFLQLYCNDELWHPRTKIGNNFLNFDKIMISGIFSENNIYEFIRNCDYLLSNKTVEELEDLFQINKGTNQISFWIKKYLKYKKKYLRLLHNS